MNADEIDLTLAKHYAPCQDLTELILDALEKAGKDPDRLRPEDLTPIDEFHILGRKATLELAQLCGFEPSTRVLDVGSGLGGPSRCIAETFGCRVEGIDITEEYCRTASMLAERLGMSSMVTYRQGDALALPYRDDSFDVVWSQHTSMNIEDKAGLYREMRRVLRPGGILAIYDIVAGAGGEPLFPVPWAREPGCSHLLPGEELKRIIEETGFSISSWHDTTEEGRNWFRAFAGKMQGKAPSPLGLHLLLGSDFAAMARNQRDNLDQGRIATIQMTATNQK